MCVVCDGAELERTRKLHDDAANDDGRNFEVRQSSSILGLQLPPSIKH